MIAGCRKNLFWVFIAGVVVAVGLLRGMSNVIPDGPYDVLKRAWPALLVFIGLSLLLRGRIPWGRFVAVCATVGLAAGVAVLGYTVQSSKESDAQQHIIDQPVGDSVTLLAVHITTLETDVILLHALARSDGIGGQFTGSAQSEISIHYIEHENGIAELTVLEEKLGGLPVLDAVGRGRLLLEIPPGLGLDIAFNGKAGDATLDLGQLSLERLNVELMRGDIHITLPEYQPQSPNAADEPGRLRVFEGDLILTVPDTVDVRVEFDRRGGSKAPRFPASYIEVRDATDGMLRRDQETAEIRFWYAVIIPDGHLSLELRPNG